MSAGPTSTIEEIRAERRGPRQQPGVEDWEARQAAGDWERGDPANASANLAEADRPPLSDRVLSTRQLAELPPPAWLIDGLLPEGGLTVMYGPAGSGKSFLAVSMALSLSTGVDFLGHLVKTPARSLYVVGEGVRGISRRVDAWKVHHGQHDDDVEWLDGSVNLANHLHIDELAGLVNGDGIGLVVVDTFARCTVGVEENSAREVGEVIANLDRLRSSTNCTILVVHHSGKDITRGSRGASSLKGAADAELEVVTGRLSVAKMKDASEEASTPFTLEPVAESVVAVTSGSASTGIGRPDTEALEALDAACVVDGHTISCGEWRDASGLASTTFYNARNHLLTLGLVTQDGIGRSARYRPNVSSQAELGEGF